MAAANTIIQLREHLASRFPGSAPKAERHLARSMRGLEAALPEGFPRGAITELISPQGNGLLLTALFEAAREENLFVALVDSHDSLDLQAVPMEMLSRFLWVRCRNVEEAIKAADLVLRDGNLSFVLLNLRGATPLELRQVPTRNWYRLQRIVEMEESALVALTHASTISAAKIKLQVETRFDLASFDQPRHDLIAELQAASLRTWQVPAALSA